LKSICKCIYTLLFAVEVNEPSNMTRARTTGVQPLLLTVVLHEMDGVSSIQASDTLWTRHLTRYGPDI